MHNSFHDDFFARNQPSVVGRIGFALWFAFCAVASLAFLGVIVWAIIALVTWVTTK